MSSNSHPADADPAVREPIAAPLTRWQKLRLVVKVVELRLRFIVLMAGTGLVFAYWDTLWNRYDKWMRPASAHHVVAVDFEFYCPMHPSVVQEEPGSCPICGMTLAKRQRGEKTPLPVGVTARVELSPLRIAQAGIKTAEVGYSPMSQTLTTVGVVAFDERRIANIVSKVAGKSRVETLYVNVTGQEVVAGQRLAELYSPELSQAIQELLIAALRTEPAVQPQTELARSLLSDRRALVRASSEKLQRWGITGAQIEQVLQRGKSDFKFTILSPIGGHVFKKNVVEGQEVPEGFPMFEVVDLDTVWIQAQVYEHQLGMVHEGQAALATVEAFSGETFPGKLEFIQPHLDPASRTVEVRYALDNPGHRLRPGMFATVRLDTPMAETPAFRSRIAAAQAASGKGRLVRLSLTVDEQRTCPVTTAKLGSMGEPISVELEGGKIWTCCSACPPKLKAQPAKYLGEPAPPPRDQVLSVDESAVVDTGTRTVVYVETGPGVFEGREVVLGPRAGNRFPVLEGLNAGDKVAAAGAFLIDAESRLNPNVAPPDSAAPTEGPHRH
jgi:membrane fusion protein, copper/silver efflux system